MNAKELIRKACKNAGCDETMFCFGGKQRILCREVISECKALRKAEIEEEMNKEKVKE